MIYCVLFVLFVSSTDLLECQRNISLQGDFLVHMEEMVHINNEGDGIWYNPSNGKQGRFSVLNDRSLITGTLKFVLHNASHYEELIWVAQMNGRIKVLRMERLSKEQKRFGELVDLFTMMKILMEVDGEYETDFNELSFTFHHGEGYWRTEDLQAGWAKLKLNPDNWDFTLETENDSRLYRGNMHCLYPVKQDASGFKIKRKLITG